MLRSAPALILIATLLPALAAPTPARASGFITLKDGSIVQGHLLSINDRQLTGVVDPDGDERTFKREELSPRSWYMARSRTAGDVAGSRLELARFCLQHQLFGSAMEELKKVWDLEEGLREPAMELWDQARDGAANELLRITENALKRNNVKNTRRLATQILNEFDGTAAAGRAGEILDQLQADKGSRPTMEEQIHQALTQEQVEKMSVTDPRAIEARKHLERARERNHAGLRDRSMSAAGDHFLGSIRDYTRVLEIVDQVLQEEKDELVIVKRVGLFKETVDAEVIETYLNWAGLLASRSSYNKAIELVNECLGKYPRNERAMNYRMHVETLQAISAGDRFSRKHRR